jgi:hypothetical protein
VSLVPNNGTIAKALQACAVDRLQAGAEFARVPIIGRRKGTIANDIEAAIAELGACIFVMPGLPVHFIGLQAPTCDRYELRIRAIEDPAINQNLPDVWELVELIIRRMHGIDFDAIGLTNPIVFPESGNPVAEVSDPNRLIYDVIFETDAGYLPRVDP